MKTKDKTMMEAKSFRERYLIHTLILTGNTNIWDIQYSPYDGTDKWDVKWSEPIFAGKQIIDIIDVIAEIKVRTYPISAYNGWMIEKDKYDYLMAQPQEKKLYINIHPDGIQIWDLAEVSEPNWNSFNLPVDNQGEAQRLKITGDLQKSDTTKHLKQIDIYDALDKALTILKKRQDKITLTKN